MRPRVAVDATTNEKGTYAFPPCCTANYTLRVELRGFKEFLENGEPAEPQPSTTTHFSPPTTGQIAGTAADTDAVDAVKVTTTSFNFCPFANTAEHNNANNYLPGDNRDNIGFNLDDPYREQQALLLRRLGGCAGESWRA